MTVGELKKLLDQYPDDYDIMFPNTDHYINGYYIATSVDGWDDYKKVLIDTDNKVNLTRLWETTNEDTI